MTCDEVEAHSMTQLEIMMRTKRQEEAGRMQTLLAIAQIGGLYAGGSKNAQHEARKLSKAISDTVTP